MELELQAAAAQRAEVVGSGSSEGGLPEEYAGGGGCWRASRDVGEVRAVVRRSVLAALPTCRPAQARVGMHHYFVLIRMPRPG